MELLLDYHPYVNDMTEQDTRHAKDGRRTNYNRGAPVRAVGTPFKVVVD